jgi:hypothetical protein
MRLLFIMATIAIVTLVGCATSPTKSFHRPMPNTGPPLSILESTPDRTAILRTIPSL